MEFDKRETAAILAGLRCLQLAMANRELKGVLEIACDEGNVVPLDIIEIDALSEKLNCGAMLKLFFIGAADDNGVNQDRIVWAADRKQAIQLANTDWGYDGGDFDGPAHDDCRIMEIDTTSCNGVGVVEWNLENAG